MTNPELSVMLKKVQKLSNTLNDIRPKFDELVEEEYGYHYSDKDIDEIIDCVDYGNGFLTFCKFDRLMRENMTTKNKNGD